MPSQMGYHCGSQQAHHQHQTPLLTITYPMPLPTATTAASGADKGAPEMPRQKRKDRPRIHPEPPEGPVKKEPWSSGADERVLASPVRPSPHLQQPADVNTEPSDEGATSDGEHKSAKKKVKSAVYRLTTRLEV